MNKKFRIIIAITLIIQLIIPAGLLYRHYTAIDFALNHSLDYRFKLLDIGLYGYDEDNDDSFEDMELHLEVGGIHNYYGEKIAVTVGEDGFADLAKSRKDTDCWFDYDYCYKNSNFSYGEFTFEDGVDVKALRKDIRESYAWASDLHENGSFAYVTAKVYKGVFIPTAVYVRGEKVITINVKS